MKVCLSPRKAICVNPWPSVPWPTQVLCRVLFLFAHLVFLHLTVLYHRPGFAAVCQLAFDSCVPEHEEWLLQQKLL